ncbi:UNVERIFIED_CONTAM: hypothetical protein Sradi_0389500 [Sesamum radiatum]|uniref:Uncharacterized protein n=1 Tax=Sesamum radiatum TaxID=300843 RepID=A0AAW2W7U8_SESRA
MPAARPAFLEVALYTDADCSLENERANRLVRSEKKNSSTPLLEEIRQKRAAERLSKASSGPDLVKSPTDGTNDISGLVSQLKDTMQRNAELEEANTKLTSMVKVCLKQNEELRSMVDNMRTEQTSLSVLNDKASQALNISGRGDDTIESPYAAELYSLKSQLSKEQSRAEALSGEVLQLSARLQQARQAYNGLARIYKPLLRNIENGLLKMKQDGSVTVR